MSHRAVAVADAYTDAGRHDHCDPAANRDTDSVAIANEDSDPNGDPNTDENGDALTDAYGVSVTDQHADALADSDCFAIADEHPDAITDSDDHTDVLTDLDAGRCHVDTATDTGTDGNRYVDAVTVRHLDAIHPGAVQPRQ